MNVVLVSISAIAVLLVALGAGLMLSGLRQQGSARWRPVQRLAPAVILAGGVVLGVLGGLLTLMSPGDSQGDAVKTQALVNKATGVGVARSAPGGARPSKSARGVGERGNKRVAEQRSRSAQRRRQRAEAFWERGQAAERGRNFNEAHAHYQRAVAVDPKYTTGWWALACSEALRVDAVAALEALREFHLHQGGVDVSERVRAQDDFEPLLGDPDFLEGLKRIEQGRELGSLLKRMRRPVVHPGVATAKAAAPGDLDDPEEPSLEQGLAPVSAQGAEKLARELHRRGARAERRGQHEVARNFYRQATASDPEHVQAWYDLASMEAHRGDIAASVAALKRFAALSPEVSLGERLRLDEDFEAARASDWFLEQLAALKEVP